MKSKETECPYFGSWDTRCTHPDIQAGFPPTGVVSHPDIVGPICSLLSKEQILFCFDQDRKQIWPEPIEEHEEN